MPLGQVPVLQVDGKMLTQTPAIGTFSNAQVTCFHVETSVLVLHDV